MNRNFECTDAQEADLRHVIGPMIRPLIVIIGSAIKAAGDLSQDIPITHHEMNIEDAIVKVVRIMAESERRR